LGQKGRERRERLKNLYCPPPSAKAGCPSGLALAQISSSAVSATLSSPAALDIDDDDDNDKAIAHSGIASIITQNV